MFVSVLGEVVSVEGLMRRVSSAARAMFNAAVPRKDALIRGDVGALALIGGGGGGGWPSLCV